MKFKKGGGEIFPFSFDWWDPKCRTLILILTSIVLIISLHYNNKKKVPVPAAVLYLFAIAPWDLRYCKCIWWERKKKIIKNLFWWIKKKKMNDPLFLSSRVSTSVILERNLLFRNWIENFNANFLLFVTQSKEKIIYCDHQLRENDFFFLFNCIALRR